MRYVARIKSVKERNSSSLSREPRQEDIQGRGGAQFQPSGAVGAGPGRPWKLARVSTPRGSTEENEPANGYDASVRSTGASCVIEKGVR